ncbi:MAG: hypothetical protein QNK11_01150 [Legionella sp.]|nr:hypothetical protein [Legionella sp.]
MGDFKSKLPDMKELTGMIGKLFTDVKKSVVEIVGEYKEKHKEADADAAKTAEPAQTKPPEAPKAKEPAKTEEAPKVDEPPKDE